MKGQKSNAFQLAVAGGVLLLVLVCATFAWFAASNFAFVRQIQTLLSGPSMPDNQVNQIQYSPTGGAEATDWTDYDPSTQLSFIPGQEYHFRVVYTTEAAGNITMKLIKLTDMYRNPQQENNGTPDEDDAGESAEPFESIIGEHSLVNILQYSTGTGTAQYSPLVLNGSEAKLSTFGVDNGGIHYFYYSLYMPGELENVEFKNYMNRALSFELSFEYQPTV